MAIKNHSFSLLGVEFLHKEPMKLYIGDVVRMRKVHPCGGTDWEILRVGMDFRIKCITCGRVVMLSRINFEKSIKNIIKQTIIND